ncbi:MAG: hypothetical protein AAFU49_12745 [Pseudomonadota bacterium]
MTMLIDELRQLAANPFTWASVPVLLAFLLYALYRRRCCPLLHRTLTITPEQARASADQPYTAGPRFALLMLVGIVATIASLKLIADGTYPTLAFYLLVAGVFVIQTEPVRLRLREAETRVIASELYDEDVREVAIDRLETNHLWLITIQVVILLGTVAFLLAI